MPILLVVVFWGVILPPSNGLLDHLFKGLAPKPAPAHQQNERLEKLEAAVVASHSRNAALEATVRQLSKTLELSRHCDARRSKRCTVIEQSSRSNRLDRIETVLDQIIDKQNITKHYLELNSRVKHLETALTKINHQQDSIFREMDALNKDMEQVMIKQESLMDSQYVTESKEEGPIADAVKEEEEEEGRTADAVKEEKEEEEEKEE